MTKECAGSNNFFSIYFLSNLVCGLRHWQWSSGLCGQISTSSNSIPCDLNNAIIALCGLSKSACGKESVPKPSWFDTITKRYFSFNFSIAGMTFGSNLSFSRLSIWKSVFGSSIKVPSRSMKRIGCMDCISLFVWWLQPHVHILLLCQRWYECSLVNLTLYFGRAE